MNDKERLSAFLDKVKDLDGLDEETDRRLTAELQRRLTKFGYDEQLVAKKQVHYVELEKLLHDSDIISLHVPLFPETHHLVDEAAIGRMKDGVMLINTSRGGLVDTRALVGGLKSGKIGLAGLDVYEEEAGVFFRDLSDQILTDDVLARLLTFNNLVITSHQAFLTHEALANIAETTLANLDEFEQGKRGAELTNAVCAV